MDWPLVALVLGLCSLAVAVYALRLRARDVVGKQLLESLNEATKQANETSSRVAKLEAAQRIDGERIMREAGKGALPGFMR
jgi:hypothetical protein